MCGDTGHCVSHRKALASPNSFYDESKDDNLGSEESAIIQEDVALKLVQ